METVFAPILGKENGLWRIIDEKWLSL